MIVQVDGYLTVLTLEGFTIVVIERKVTGKMQDDLIDEEKQEVEDALKQLDKLRASTGVNENLTEEDQDFIKNHKFPDGSRLRDEGVIFENSNDNVLPGETLQALTYEVWHSELV